MTLSLTSNRNRYVGTGLVGTYAYSFKIREAADLIVTVQDTDGVETTLTLTTHYTVSGEGSQSGGNIVLVNGAFAWIDGVGKLRADYVLVVRRVMDLAQSTDIRNQSVFFPEVIEDEFDTRAMIDQQQQEEIDRSLKLPISDSVAAFDPTLPPLLADNPNAVLAVNDDGDGFAIGPTISAIGGASADAAAAAASATDASEHATTASRWAKFTGGTVIDADTLVDSLEYSSKEYAIGTTAATGSAKDWATKTSADVVTGSYSAKEWATGTQTRGSASGGSSKDWATYVSNTVDNAEYSAKEYASGTQAGTGGSSKDWAQKTSAAVTGSSYSAKEWAVGTQTRGVASSGSAKDWATYTGGTVDNSGYSSKEWASGTQTRGAASGGSAKDWANYTGGTVDNAEYSAKKYATDAASSAAAAASTLASALWRGMRRLTSASSPYTVLPADNGYLLVVDTTAGAVTVNLPSIAAQTLPFNVAVQLDAGTNAITVARNGTDTIDGLTSKTITVAGAGTTFLADSTPAPDEWETIDFGLATGNLVAQNFSGDGVTTAFTLSSDPGSENNINVYVSGVYQQKNTFSVAGTTLTFASAPASGTNNIEVMIGTTLAIGTPADSTVTRAKMVAGAQARLNVVAKTTTYAATTDDDVVFCSTSGGAWSLALPSAVGISGYKFVIIKTDTSANALTIDPSGSETLDGSTTVALNKQYEARVIVSDGTNWVSQSARFADQALTAKTADYTLTLNDSTVTFNPSNSTITATLPTAVGCNGKLFVIKNIGTGTGQVNIATTSSQTIDGITPTGSSVMPLTATNMGMALQSDGSNWRTISNRFVPAARYTNSAGTGLTKSTLNTLTFATKVFDRGSNWSNTTFTAPIPGVYSINVNIMIASGISWAAGDYLRLAILKNGSVITDTYNFVLAATTTNWSATLSCLADLAATDTITVQADPHIAGAASPTLNAAASNNTINITKVCD